MYSFKQVLKQEPAAIVAVLHGWAAAVLLLLAMRWGITVPGEVLGVFEAAILATFTLLYIRPSTVSKDAMNELANAQDPLAQPPPSAAASQALPAQRG